MGRITQADLFLELAKPDGKGISRKVPVTEFTGRYRILKLGNGGSWCRKDGSLGKRFIIDRHLVKGSISYVQLLGLNNRFQGTRGIRQDILKAIRQQRCVVLDVGTVEVDHKDGSYQNRIASDPKAQSLDDFQSLSKAANNAKRAHCKKCQGIKKRYDASILGYSTGWWVGNEDYKGTCLGCYWNDPREFNKEISK